MFSSKTNYFLLINEGLGMVLITLFFLGILSEVKEAQWRKTDTQYKTALGGIKNKSERVVQII